MHRAYTHTHIGSQNNTMTNWNIIFFPPYDISNLMTPQIVIIIEPNPNGVYTIATPMHSYITLTRIQYQ